MLRSLDEYKNFVEFETQSKKEMMEVKEIEELLERPNETTRELELWIELKYYREMCEVHEEYIKEVKQIFKQLREGIQ